MIDGVINYLVKHKKPFFFLTLLGIIVAGSVCSIPSFEGKIIGFDMKENRYFKTALRINSMFGGQNKIYIKISPSQDTLKNVFSGTQKLENSLKEKFPKADIISLRPFYYGMFYRPSEKNASLSGFLNKAASYPVLNDLISNDKKSFLVVMSIDSFKNFEIDTFTSVINLPYKGISGVKAMSIYHIESTVEKYIRKDVVVLSAIIIIFFIAFFIFTFRKFSAVVFTWAIVSISIFSSVFFFSVFNFHLNLVTILVIPVVLVLSLSDSIHLLTGYVSFADIEDKNERIKKVVSRYIVPSFYSSATTSAAFLTFYFFNDSDFIREFGLITGLCLMAEFFLTFLIAPFLLQLVNVKKIYGAKVIGFSNFLEKRQTAFSVAFVILFLSSFFFIGKLNFNNSSEMFFPKGSELAATHKEMNRDFYSQVKLDILVERKNKNNSSDTTENRKLENVVHSIAAQFKKQKNVARVNSATDNYYVQSAFGMPLNFLEMLGNKNPYYHHESNTYRIEVKVNDSKVIKEFGKTILPKLAGTYPDYKISYTSANLIMEQVNKKVSRSLVNSLLTSCLSILLMIFLLTRSIRITLASLLPNLVPLSLIIFIYVISGLDINILTAITAIVCIGLLDDDTIHILYRRLWLKEKLDELSFSILSTSILLSAGFGMFYFSSFKPTQVFGVVSALVFLFGVICELTLMPKILNYWLNKPTSKNENENGHE